MLNADQVERYRRDGYLFPITALSPDEAAECLGGLEKFEAWLGTPLTQADRKWRSAGYVFLPWVDALVRHPQDPRCGRKPDRPRYPRLHQHLLHQGAAFADLCRLASGRHLFRPETSRACHGMGGADRCDRRGRLHGGGIVARHAAAAPACRSRSGRQHQWRRPGDRRGVRPARRRWRWSCLPGSFSLHHTLCRHRSAPNRASHRRIGLGISYIPASVRTIGSYRLSARPSGAMTAGAISIFSRARVRARRSRARPARTRLPPISRELRRADRVARARLRGCLIIAWHWQSAHRPRLAAPRTRRSASSARRWLGER